MIIAVSTRSRGGADAAASALRSSTRLGVLLAVVLGVLGAVVSASGAVGAFHRAMHRIHDTREGRPSLHFRLVVFVETLALMLGAVLITILVVVGGDLSQRLGQAVGLPEETVQTWNVVKWPVILVVIALIVTLAYRLGPNVRQPRYRPLSLGATAQAVLTTLRCRVAVG